MKYTYLLLVATLLASGTASAEVTNASFENWSNNTPDDWTTIDSGISLSQSTNRVKQGNASAAVTLNTGSQSNTDLRQTMDVTPGQPYEFSVWVYHTEGGARARLYVDGYRNYSDPALTYQWQKLSFNYTPGSNQIELGLRFYDVSGFDGSELIYVDDFQPAASGAGCSGTAGTLSLATDSYGSETSWEITDSQGQTRAFGDGYDSNNQYEEDVCLANGDYTLTFYDAYGDGICCQWGNGHYSLTFTGQTLASGGNFGYQETSAFTLAGDAGGSGDVPDLSDYYASAEGLSGYSLKSELHNIINNHTSQGYGALWDFYSAYERDETYEKDGSILDIYSENPTGTDPYTFAPISEQCGNYSGESDCYNREHSLPRSWFGGDIEPMNSDVHHIFASDGYVNSRRSSYPYGEVGNATFSSMNGSMLGSARSGLGYSGTVFEPIDEFKGDLARAYFYMATRYKNVIGNWQSNSSYADAVLNGSTDQVFENWFLTMLKDWHQQDPVSQKEIDRNNAAHSFQGNRNPFVDYPEFVTAIWGN